MKSDSYLWCLRGGVPKDHSRFPLITPSSAMSRFQVIAALAFCVSFPGRNVDAETLNCTFTQNGDEMTYTISDDSHATDINKSECDYFWINASEITIAYNEGHVSPVQSGSINSLTTSQCVQGLISKQECFSKTTGLLINYFANCTVPCTGNDFIPQKKDGMSKTWIATITAICLVFLVVGLCFMFKYKIWRTGGFSQCGGCYTNVKMADMDQKQTDVV